jgi:hypothetical protein
MDGVGGEIDDGDVVTVDNGSLVDGTRELLKELSKPRTLGDSVSNSPILRLDAGARDRRLSLGRPRDERGSKVNAVPRGGVPHVGAAGPVRIRVGDDVCVGGGVQRKTKVQGAADVAEYPLHQSPMSITGSVHMETHLLNGIL